MKTMTRIVLLVFTFQCYGQLSDFETVNFKKADSIALVYKHEKLTNVPQLSYKLTSHLTTEVERFRAIYMWVCQNIKNDYGLYTRNHRKRQRYQNDSLKLKEWNDQFKRISFQKLLKHNRAICTGYAYLVNELAKYANLECEIIQGYGKTSTIDIEKLTLPNHTWNAVKLNGKWYLSDATWASGIPNPDTNKFKFDYNDGFFFPNPELFAINHYPVESKWILLKEDVPSFQNFLDAPILYNEAYNWLSIHIEPKIMHHSVSKNQKITFRYELLKPVETKNIYFMIDNGLKNITIPPNSVIIENKRLTLEHAFSKSGFYDVHLKINENLIATYTVKVN